MSKWVRICNAEDLGDGHTYRFESGNLKILLANIGGSVYATDLICTHAEADLSNGFLGNGGIRCPLHLSVFDLESGAPRNLPAEEPLSTYNVKINDGIIYVEVL